MIYLSIYILFTFYSRGKKRQRRQERRQFISGLWDS